MAQAGVLKAVVVITDPEFANRLRDYVPTVVSRQVWSDHDPLPDLNGDEAHDRATARAWWSGPLHATTVRCRQDVFVQLVNEQSFPWDGYFYDELMLCAEKEGYRLAICNDSGGCPGDQRGQRALWFDADGLPHSDFFVSGRLIALRHAARMGHLYATHVYGNITDGLYHRTAEPGAYPWFGGRQFYLLSLFDLADVPDLIVTEFGSAATQYTQALGFQECWDNYAEYVEYTAAKFPALMKKCRGICQWSWGSAPGFAGQYVDAWSDQFTAKLLATASARLRQRIRHRASAPRRLVVTGISP